MRISDWSSDVCSSDLWLPVLAPSPLREPAHRAFPKAAEDWDLERIAADYADAAEQLQAGGLDGIELEAYGHLMDQFWAPATHTRHDDWGGIPDHRLNQKTGVEAKCVEGRVDLGGRRPNKNKKP